MRKWLTGTGDLSQLTQYPVLRVYASSSLPHSLSFRTSYCPLTPCILRMASSPRSRCSSPRRSLSELTSNSPVQVPLLGLVFLPPFIFPEREKYSVILKRGDDLRQDQLIVQLISLMDRLLKRENLDLNLVTYKVPLTFPLLYFSERLRSSPPLARTG